MSLVENEQAKLTATYFNGVAIALAAIGGVGPWVALVQGSSAPVGVVSICTALCILLSLSLHLAARRVLRKLLS